MGKNCDIGNVLFDYSFSWLITIGDDCTITDNVIILAHDASTKRHIGYTKIGAVTIGNKCFIGVGSIILPGVRIGNNVVIGAGSVVTNDIPDNSVAMGNPAKTVESIENFIDKHEKKLKKYSSLIDWSLNSGIPEANKENILESIKKEKGYVK